MGHFWHNVPKDTVRDMSAALEAGHSGLVIVVVNPKGNDILPLLAGAERVVDDAPRKATSRAHTRTP